MDLPASLISKVPVLGWQFSPTWEDPETNRERVRNWLTKAAPAAGSWILLPEMFTSGFSMNAGRFAEEPVGPTAVFLQHLARDWKIWITAGWAVKENPGPRFANEAWTFRPDGTMASRYRKIHTFTPGKETGAYEKGQVIEVFEGPLGPTAVFICYDLRFPEIFRHATRQGAQTFVVLASWPQARIHHWDLLTRARAVENQAWVIALNRTGWDPYLKHTGSSRIIEPNGEVVVALEESEATLEARLSTDRVQATRQQLPFLEDMQGNWLTESSACPK